MVLYSAELLLRAKLDNNNGDIKVRCKVFWIESGWRYLEIEATWSE